jgi:hypothetical protein
MIVDVVVMHGSRQSQDSTRHSGKQLWCVVQGGIGGNITSNAKFSKQVNHKQEAIIKTK